MLAVRMRNVAAVTATRVLRRRQAERTHALKNQGEGKQQLECDAFHARLLYAQ